MAKARPSRLEQAAMALAALLAAVGSAVRGVIEQASHDSDRNEKVKSRVDVSAIPRIDRSRDRCSAERGQLVVRKWHMSKLSREYQARVTGFKPYTEWKFERIEFDGFHAQECRLKEAKARYDQFFNRKTGDPRPFFKTRGAERVVEQARRQSAVIRTNPSAKLTWYFMQPVSHRYFSDRFARESLAIESLLYP